MKAIPWLLPLSLLVFAALIEMWVSDLKMASFVVFCFVAMFINGLFVLAKEFAEKAP